MEQDEDLNNYRMKHESDKEWSMRRAFLLAHRDKFNDTRLRCLASCYINVECYGCRYPPALMHQLTELMAELPKQSNVSFTKCGMPQPVKFVPAQRTDSKFDNAAKSSLPDTVNAQLSDSLPQCSVKASKLEASFHSLAGKLKEVYGNKSLTESKSVTELLQIAIDKARMTATTKFAELGPGKGFRCDLLLDFVLVSSGEAQNKRLAKQDAYVSAAELLRKPGLRVLDDAKPDVSNFRLVSSQDLAVTAEKPFLQHANVNIAVHSLSRQSNGRQPTTKGPAVGRDLIQSSSKRSADSLHGGSLKDFVILQPGTVATGAVNILQQSADFNKWSLEYDMSEMGVRCRCHVSLGGHLLSDAVGENKSTAKMAAAEQALKQLTSTCCTVCIKQLGDEDLDDTLKRSEVLGGKEKETRIPDSNVGSQLLKKMGWTGGGVGKSDNRGIEEPVSLVAVVNRAGLGSTQRSDFAPSVKRVIADFISSGGHDDLVFSPEFTSEERAVIHAEARKRHLKTRSYGSGNQRHLILSLQRTPLELVNHLRAHGGETVKYSLIEPSG